MRFSVRVPGSCGEIVQGVAAGIPFLLTCPVGLYSTVVVSDGKTAAEPLPPKASRALAAVLDYLHCRHFPYHLRLSSDLPVGKGMASSSADVTAVLAAAALALGRALTEAEIGQLAAAIDPVDGVFASGLALIQQRRGRVLRHYQPVPALSIAVLDAGGCIDTQAFHAGSRDNLPENTGIPLQALQLLDKDLTTARLGQAATMSALANQSLLPKPQLTELIACSRKYGALGVNAAHSGTVCGVFFSGSLSLADIRCRALAISREVPAYTYLMTVPLISGGIEIQREEEPDGTKI